MLPTLSQPGAPPTEKKQFTKTNVSRTFQEHFCNITLLALDAINMLMTTKFKPLALRTPLNLTLVYAFAFSISSLDIHRALKLTISKAGLLSFSV